MVDYTAHEQDSFQRYIRVLSADTNGVATPRSLVGARLMSIIRKGPDKQSDPAPANFQVVLDNAATGVVELTLPAGHALKAGTLWYEVDAILADGERLTIGAGKLVVVPTIFA